MSFQRLYDVVYLLGINSLNIKIEFWRRSLALEKPHSQDDSDNKNWGKNHTLLHVFSIFQHMSNVNLSTSSSITEFLELTIS